MHIAQLNDNERLLPVDTVQFKNKVNILTEYLNLMITVSPVSVPTIGIEHYA